MDREKICLLVAEWLHSRVNLVVSNLREYLTVSIFPMTFDCSLVGFISIFSSHCPVGADGQSIVIDYRSVRVFFFFNLDNYS